MENNFHIKKDNHFKLYVLLKDKITFESELQKNGIKFYSNLNEQASIDEGIRYFLLDSDMQRIDGILTKNGIVANSETNLVEDFQFHNKKIMLTVLLSISIIGIMILIAFILDKFI